MRLRTAANESTPGDGEILIYGIADCRERFPHQVREKDWPDHGLGEEKE